MADLVRQGGCNCGRVRLELRGEPLRAGLCHCPTCRKETGGPFMAFGVWDQAAVTVTGAAASWTATTDRRHFCPVCGSALFATHDADNEVEVRLGALDAAPSDVLPAYEALGRTAGALAAARGRGTAASRQPDLSQPPGRLLSG